MHVTPLGLVAHHRRHHRRPALRRLRHRPPPARAVDEGGRHRAGRLRRRWPSLFGIGVWCFAGHQYGTEFFAGWLTEYSLSVDNLFIFIIIMAKFAVPRQLPAEALLVGIVLALVMRGIFIAVGAAAINNFSWVFYLFGALPRLHGGQAGQGGQRRRRRRVRGEPADQVRSSARCPRPSEWHGTKLADQGERQAGDHPDVHRDRRARHDRPAVRARLDPGDLRPDPGALPGADRQHLRADGPAPALLPDRRAARSAWSTSPTAWRSCSASSASS